MKGEAEVLYSLAKKYIKKGGSAAEVGSWKGKSTYILASICKDRGAKLISIDTFAGPDSAHEWKNDPFYKPVKNPAVFFHRNIERNLKGFPVKYLKMTSRKARSHIMDYSLDFCFLDGDHRLPAVEQDIVSYKRKVKHGGVLLGHDYSPENNPHNDVRITVNKLIGRKNIGLYYSIWLYKL